MSKEHLAKCIVFMKKRIIKISFLWYWHFIGGLKYVLEYFTRIFDDFFQILNKSINILKYRYVRVAYCNEDWYSNVYEARMLFLNSFLSTMKVFIFVHQYWNNSLKRVEFKTDTLLIDVKMNYSIRRIRIKKLNSNWSIYRNSMRFS